MQDDAAHLAVPIWSGGPAEFEQFCTACLWHEKTLKTPERSQGASRVSSRLQGAAKSVERHLDPDDYESADGLHTEAASGAAR